MFCPPTFSVVDIFCTNAHGIRWVIGSIFVKFSQLILVKIIKIVATRCQILRLNASNSISSGADPAGGAYSAPQTP